VVARANYREILAGRGTRHEGVWLDITRRPKEYIMRRLPGAYEAYRRLGVDISRERMEVAPTAHYTMGGIRFDGRNYHTNVPGLWAVGEATAAVHGANRLGGNSLAEIIVFGRLIGERLAGEARKARPPLDPAAVQAAADDLAGLRRRKAGLDPARVKEELQTMMWHKAGILRTGKELREGLRALEGIRKRAARVRSASVTDVTAALELRGMLVSCEAILRSALLRTESRGAHYRTDHPRTSGRWLRSIICRKTEQGMQLRTVPVPVASAAVRAELKRKRKTTHHLLE
jgi:succinate dehydrogenase / fumarate reductase flavoprotein subunit